MDTRLSWDSMQQLSWFA